MTKTRAVLLEDALAEIKRLRQALHRIKDIDQHKYTSNGRKVEIVKGWAEMALMDVEEP